MSSLSKIIKDDRHPLWLVDAIILSAVVYSKDPQEELESMNQTYGLPPSARYEFVSEQELQEAGFGDCRQTLLVVRSLTGNQVIAAFRGTFDLSDALTDLNFLHRTLSLGPGAAHAGFLDRAKTIPLEYFRRLLVRGDNLVLTGHSLGGAVASLLALRLLESTGRWCHEQLQCYTFGSPFFADYRLARHINLRYKHHFVHIVSRSDIVPKVMPVAYLIYSLWAGLSAGPLQDVVHLFNLFLMASQLFIRRKSFKFKFLTVCSQTVAWVPGLLRSILHRALALALSHQSGCGYAFAGKMVLLDPESSLAECVDQDMWTVKHHLDFHLGTISFDVMKGHSLFSYIDQVFAIQSAEASVTMDNGANAPTKVEVSTASLNMQWTNNRGKRSSYRRDVATITEEDESQEESSSSRSRSRSRNLVVRQKQQQQLQFKQKVKQHVQQRSKRAVRNFRSRVACLIFARRIQEASTVSYMQRKERRRPWMRFLVINLGRASRFAHRFDALFICSSIFYVGVQLHKLWAQRRSS